MKLLKLTLTKDSRMLRVGFGKNDGKWFARVDLWCVAWRITR